jgi:hypothetical protein
MRVAVVTPYAGQPAEWLRQGHESVRAQGVDATHFLVADGAPDPAAAALADQHIVLRHRHGDGGNAARMAGGLSAASQRFDAVTFLDPGDWFLPGHLKGLLAAVAADGAEAATALCLLHRIDGTPVGGSPHVDGVRTVDASGVLLMPTAFPAIALWCLAPAPVAGDAVQSLLGYLQGRRRRIARAGPEPTVAKRVRARAFNAPFGTTAWDAFLTDEAAPRPEAVRRWWQGLAPDVRAAALRRIGVD